MGAKRRRFLFSFLIALAAVALLRWASGTPHSMHRGVGAVETRSETLSEVGEAERIAKSSWENHDDFEIGAIELDDQGIFWDRRQLETATAQIRAASATGAIVVVFVHGWQHDGRVCDGNLCCLRESLRYLAEAEESFSHLRGGVRRRVLGIFFGWRGASAGLPVLAQTTFWDRLEAARRVGGRGDALAAFSAIHAATEELRSTPRAAATRLVIIGHSMGARLTWSALGKKMETQLLDAINSAPQACANPGMPMRGFADLTVFVNPAFEAAEIRSLLETARGYRGYCPSQTPIALIAMSESDRATGIAFPLGRKLATLTQGFRGDERAQAVTAIGHYPPFDTHRLTLVGEPPTQVDPARRAAACGCATALGHFDPERHLANLRRNGESRDFKNLHFALSRSYGGSRLSQLPGVPPPPELPFLVARVEPAIIDGHGDFFNPAFIDFLVNLVAAIDYKRAAWEEAG